MWKVVIGIVALGISVQAAAVEFLGINLCNNTVDTSVRLPPDSPLVIQSVEIGKHGALVMLLEGGGAGALDRVDDVMSRYTGSRGSGDSRQLQWSGNTLTAVAELLKKGQVALVVKSGDPCGSAGATDQEPPSAAPSEAVNPVAEAAPAEPHETQAAPTVATPDGGLAAATAAVASASPGSLEDPNPESETPAEAFELDGDLDHAPAVDGWVDVMGVVNNNTGTDYRLATFDVAFFDEAGDLICVDTISVTQLKGGRSRAFRDSIECPGYEAESVARSELQFAGGY